MDRIEVKTKLGTMIAEQSSDPDYPGIYLSLITEDEDGEKDILVALIEKTPYKEYDAEKIRLVVWGNTEKEDYTDEFTYVNNRG